MASWARDKSTESRESITIYVMSGRTAMKELITPLFVMMMSYIFFFLERIRGKNPKKRMTLKS